MNNMPKIVFHGTVELGTKPHPKGNKILKDNVLEIVEWILDDDNFLFERVTEFKEALQESK